MALKLLFQFCNAFRMAHPGFACAKTYQHQLALCYAYNSSDRGGIDRAGHLCQVRDVWLELYLNSDMGDFGIQSPGPVTGLYCCQEGQDWKPNSEMNLALGYILGSSTSASPHKIRINIFDYPLLALTEGSNEDKRAAGRMKQQANVQNRLDVLKPIADCKSGYEVDRLAD